MANLNPSPETRFQPGSTPNPGGKSKELKRLEMEAAEMAAKLRHAALSSMMEKLAKASEAPEPDPDMAMKLINADTLRLFKDSEDRAHGTPKAVTEIGGTDAPIKLAIQRTIVDPQG